VVGVCGLSSFSVLTLLVGQQERCLACKNLLPLSQRFCFEEPGVTTEELGSSDETDCVHVCMCVGSRGARVLAA